MGGLPKKAFQFNRLIQNSGRPFVIVDGGALFFDNIRPHRYKFDQIRAKARGIVKAYNMIGYDAVGVAGQDLAGGLAFLQELAETSDFSWLSANLVARDSGRPYFQTHISKELGGIRVAIVGLTSADIAEARLLDEGAEIRGWDEVLPPLAKNLKKSHQFIVLLTDLAPDLCAAISRRLPEVNFIVRAGGDLENHAPRPIGAPSTLIASTGRQGKYVGALTVNWIKDGVWGEPDEDSILLKEKQADLDRTSAHLSRIREHVEMATLVGNLERKMGVLADEVSQLKKRVESRKLSRFTNSFYEMSDSVPDDPDVLAVVLEIRENVAELGRQRAEPAAGNIARPAGYLGWRSCSTCHGEGVAKWKQTKHAGAYETLVRKNRQNDFDCLPCHLTGIDFDNVATALTLPDSLRTVGCEVCHGPGGEHVGSEGKVGMGRVSGRICVRCHVPEHDDSHEFERDVMKIRCNRQQP